MCLSLPIKSWAEDKSNVEPWAQENSESEPAVEGAMIGGEVILGGDSTSLGPTFAYWGESIGVRAGLAVSLLRAKIEAGGASADSDQTATGWGGDLLVGLPSGRAKPYLGVGIQRSSTKQEQNDGKDAVSTELSSTDLNLGLGVDFAAAEHAVIGLGLLRISYILDGSLKSGTGNVDLSGYAFGLLSSFSVRYVF